MTFEQSHHIVDFYLSYCWQEGNVVTAVCLLVCAWWRYVLCSMIVDILAGLFIRRFCLAFEKLSFSHVVQLYQRFRLMYCELKDKSSDVDVAGSIVNETRDLSLEDLLDHCSNSSSKAWSVRNTAHIVPFICVLFWCNF